MSARGGGVATAARNPFPPDPILVETLDRLLGNVCTHEAVQAAEATGWSDEIWQPLAGTGAPWVGVEEALGGSGGTVADAAAVLRRCGYFAAPVPVAETGLLGGWLAGAAGLPLPDGPVAVVPGHPDDRFELDGDRLSGVAHNVAWAAASSLVLAIVRDRVVAFDPAAATIRPRRNLAGEPREVVELAGVAVTVAPAPEGVTAELLRRRGAFARACLMTGALERVTDLTVGYANERQQFGKPIATFQAVAQHLVRLASETHLATMAFQAAVAAVSHRGFEGAGLEVASAKAVAGEAADVATARAHQAHGAIGMTQEYDLHQLTRRLWSWREEFGSTASWRREVGAAVATALDATADAERADGNRLWELVSQGSEVLAG
jgi:acyl-CoA dehydrogenase